MFNLFKVMFNPLYLLRNVLTLYNGGGGGGGGGSDEASRLERDRQERTQNAVNAINDIFNSSGRDALYQNQRNAVYNLNAQDVNRQYEVAERNNRFNLARMGQLGGALDIDKNADLNRITNEGLMRSSGLADDAAASLRNSDEGSRTNLISMAQAGIDSTQASQQAYNQLNANSANASSDRAAANVGDLFGNLANTYVNGKTLGAYNNAFSAANNAYGNNRVSSTGTSFKGN